MYGFKPQHARGKPVQNFADGGIVHSIKGALGLRPRTREELMAADAERVAKLREAAASVAERNKAAPSAPQQQGAISGYAGMSATQRREKELGLKDGGVVPRGFKPGGLIRGPGTGTSDSIQTEKRPGTFIMPADSTQAIGPEALEELGEVDDSAVEEQGEKVPVRLSNGEFELPPEQVQALGEAVLTVLRDATHERTEEGRQASPKAAGFAPSQFFADGGTVQDDKQKRLANQTAMHVIGAQEAAANRPKPAPEAKPVAPPAAAPSSAPVAAGFMPGTRAVFNESGKAIGDLAKQGRYGAAAGETARAALAYVPAVADDVIGGAVRAVGPGIVDAGRQFLGMNDGAAAAITNPTDARLTAGTRRAPSGFDPAIKPQVAAAPTVPQQAPVTAPVQRMAQQPQAPAFDFDNYQPAPGQGAFRNEQTGEVTRLQDGPSPTRDTRIWKEPNVLPRSDARPAAQRQEVRAPVLNPNGGVFAAMADFTNQAGQAVQAIAANKGMRNDRKDALDQQRVGLDAASTFAKIEQGDRALGIDGRRADTAQDLASLQADELGLKREAAGFQTRAAAQQEQLRNVLLDPKSTPEQRAVAQRNLAALSGKTAADRMQTVALPDTTNEMGQVVRGGQALVRVLEDGTVQQVPIGAAAPAPIAAPKAGEVRNGYRFKGGNPNDQANWTKV